MVDRGQSPKQYESVEAFLLATGRITGWEWIKIRQAQRTYETNLQLYKHFITAYNEDISLPQEQKELIFHNIRSLEKGEQFLKAVYKDGKFISPYLHE